GWTPLQLAVNCGQAVSARMLLRAGADVDAQGAGGLTSLHRAIASCDRGEGLIPLLLAHGALPEIPDKFGDTPLHLAVKNTRIHGVQALLVGGADIDARGRNNETPLTQVMESKDEELIRTLLEHGATVCRRDWKGYSALESAIHQGLVSTVRLLLGEYDADQSIQKPTEFMKMLDVLANSPFSDPDTIEVLLGYGTNVNAKDRDGNTPLHNAARSGNTALARKLREHGASTHLQNRKGLTPLDMAKRHRT
ncbi:ankyrin, partial [Byssothecium circinans]